MMQKYSHRAAETKYETKEKWEGKSCSNRDTHPVEEKNNAYKIIGLLVVLTFRGMKMQRKKKFP